MNMSALNRNWERKHRKFICNDSKHSSSDEKRNENHRIFRQQNHLFIVRENIKKCFEVEDVNRSN